MTPPVNCLLCIMSIFRPFFLKKLILNVGQPKKNITGIWHLNKIMIEKGILFPTNYATIWTIPGHFFSPTKQVMAREADKLSKIKMKMSVIANETLLYSLSTADVVIRIKFINDFKFRHRQGIFWKIGFPCRTVNFILITIALTFKSKLKWNKNKILFTLR